MEPAAPRTTTPRELGLTRREQEILAWVTQGKTNPEVAQVLWLAPSTVRKHLENVYAKLGVHTRTAAVVRFLDSVDDEVTRASADMTNDERA